MFKRELEAPRYSRQLYCPNAGKSSRGIDHGKEEAWQRNRKAALA